MPQRRHQNVLHPSSGHIGGADDRMGHAQEAVAAGQRRILDDPRWDGDRHQILHRLRLRPAHGGSDTRIPGRTARRRCRASHRPRIQDVPLQKGYGILLRILGRQRMAGGGLLLQDRRAGCGNRDKETDIGWSQENNGHPYVRILRRAVCRKMRRGPEECGSRNQDRRSDLPSQCIQGDPGQQGPGRLATVWLRV